MDGLCQTPMGAETPMPLLAGALGCLCPSLLAACIPCISCIPSSSPASIPAAKGRAVVPSGAAEAAPRAGCACLGGGQEEAVLRMDLLP